MNTRIIVDSTADLTPAFKSRVHIVPLTVRFGEEEYIDGVTIDHKTFYEKLIENDVLPTTSQATPDAFMQEFKKAKAADEAAVVITLSSKFSGTYQSAMIAAEEFENIYIVDSGTAAMGSGILVELAFRLLDEGKNAKDIALALEEEKKKIVIVALVDTLEYLKKGGRISAATALAGSLLSIKPVITLEDGKVEMVGKARGSRQGNNLLRELVHKCGGINFSKPVALAYSGLSDALLRKYIADSEELWQGNAQSLSVTTVGCAIGTHVGPGAIAVAFFENDKAQS